MEELIAQMAIAEKDKKMNKALEEEINKLKDEIRQLKDRENKV